MDADKHKQALKQVLERQLANINDRIDRNQQKIADATEALKHLEAERDEVRAELDAIGD